MDEFLDRLGQQNKATEQAWSRACQGASVILQRMGEQLIEDLRRIDRARISQVDAALSAATAKEAVA